MKKNSVKILLDIAMVVILTLLYNSHVYNMTFHEVSGLIIFMLFVIHCLLNKKWISSVTSKLFNRSLPVRIRFGYMIDLLLAFTFILIVIGGILTSQALFPTGVKNSPWRYVHHFCAAVSLVLVGIHLGLHWNFVSGMFKKIIRVPPKAAKPLGIILTIAILAFGAYNIAASSFTRWLAEPFTTEAKSGAPAGVQGDISSSGEHTPKSGENKNGGNEGQAVPKAGEEAKQGSPDTNAYTEKKPPEGSPKAVVSTIAVFLSIIGAFTAVTRHLDKLFSRKGNR